MLLPCPATWTHWPSGRGCGWVNVARPWFSPRFWRATLARYPSWPSVRSRLGNEKRGPACDLCDGVFAHLIRTVRNVAMLLCSRKQTNQAPVVWLHRNTSTSPRVLFASFFNKQKKQIYTCSNSGAVVRTLRTCISASRSILVLLKLAQEYKKICIDAPRMRCR